MLAPKTYPLEVGGSCCARVRGDFQILKLVEQVGSDGAEGRVFRGQAKNLNYAIKIYSHEYRGQGSDERLLRKLTLMVAAGQSFLSSTAPLFAWPLATVHLGSKQSHLTANRFIGFAMPIGENLISLPAIAEQAKKHRHPDLTERHLIAYYLARGFAMIHMGAEVRDVTGPIRVTFAIGDVNDSNIAVTRDYYPFFLDCDSYIIRTPMEVFDHAYGRPEYASPEYLTAKAHNGSKVRAASDDNYGLAVLIFRLLNDWQRPYLYRGAKSLSPKDLIPEGRFPYGPSTDEVIPDAVNALKAYNAEIDPRLKALFERTFLKGRQRPTAAEWVTALSESAQTRIVQKPSKAPPRPSARPQLRLVRRPRAPIAPAKLPAQQVASNSLRWLIGFLVVATLILLLRQIS